MVNQTRNVEFYFIIYLAYSQYFCDLEKVLKELHLGIIEPPTVVFPRRHVLNNCDKSKVNSLDAKRLQGC